MRINLYAQNRHILLIAGIQISGFANGDFMSVKVDGNAAKRTQGGDGPAMNLSVEQGGTITIKLLPTSPALGTLYKMREAQKSNPILFALVLMTGVEEKIAAAGCAFGELDEFGSGGEEMSERTFKIECLKIALDPSDVNPVSGSLI